MKIEKRVVNGCEITVYIEEYPGENKDWEIAHYDAAHADRVASQLAKNKDFIAAIAKAIMDAPIDPIRSYTASIPIQQSGDYKDSDERKGR